jgi:hypothetical protein
VAAFFTAAAKVILQPRFPGPKSVPQYPTARQNGELSLVASLEKRREPKDIQGAYLSNSSVASMPALFFLQAHAGDSHLAAATLTADFAKWESF